MKWLNIFSYLNLIHISTTNLHDLKNSSTTLKVSKRRLQGAKHGMKRSMFKYSPSYLLVVTEVSAAMIYWVFRAGAANIFTNCAITQVYQLVISIYKQFENYVD